jgi:hypothetical protein
MELIPSLFAAVCGSRLHTLELTNMLFRGQQVQLGLCQLDL